MQNCGLEGWTTESLLERGIAALMVFLIEQMGQREMGMKDFDHDLHIR